MARNPLGDLGNGLGDYLREQRLSARLSVRQLSELAGISNPYLSQIERGLKRPSADILQQIAKGLSISAETLYVQAGLLDPDEEAPAERPTAREAIAADLRLTSRQRQTLIDIYDSFVGSPADAPAPPRPEKTAAARSREATPSSTTPKKRTTTPRKRTSAPRTSSATSRSTKTTS